ncbi:MAG: L-aspartate oxidase [Armatimonadota bacterium]
MNTIDCDFLVVGTGIAGLTYALKVAEYGRVVLVTKKNDTDSNTNYAQGGIAAVLGSDDNFGLHVEDTLTAGAGLCHPDVVEILVEEGPTRVKELMEMGVRFTEEMAGGSHGVLSLGREGGHSRRRIVRAADLTGREVERALVYQAKCRESIRVFENDMVIGLLTATQSDGSQECVGAHVFDTETRDTYTVRSKITMLSTGGLGRAYLRTTNPDIATGDGIAFAYWLGARIANMEFIQFHPTSLYHERGDAFLISEAVRGEGGVLRLKNGRTFMEHYHGMGCLAPRDVVARAIDSELKKSGEECVYLDITHMGEEEIKRHFPNIYARLMSLGIDAAKQWIPTVPAAHYSCGGVLTDSFGRTDIPRLYAAGEVACTGVHGANRLASNSLLEALVFSHRAAEHAIETLGGIELANNIPDFPKDKHIEPVPMELVKALVLRLRTCLWVFAGIVRSTDRLKSALEELNDIEHHGEALWRRGKLSRDLLELKTMVTVAKLIVNSALSRHESRGLQYITDYPQRDDENWLFDTVLRLRPASNAELGF